MSARICKTGWIFLFVWAVILKGGLLRGDEAFDPHTGEVYTGPLSPVVKTTGITYGVALYACSTGAPTALPSWWQTLWNPNEHPSQRSVARYYKDVSRGVYQLQITPYGRDAGHAFVSSWSPSAQRDLFMYDVVGQADTLVGINFADYDNDGPNGIPASQDFCDTGSCMLDSKKGDDDGYVDAVFILADGVGSHNSLWYGADYVTRDTGAHGQYIKVSGGDRGVRTCGGEAWQICAYSVICHDWGHILGLGDYFSPIDEGAVAPEQFNWRVLGTFSLMGNPHAVDNREVPVDPYSQIKLGWVRPDSIVEVDAPLYAGSIPNFVTSGKIYKIRKSPSEYFLVTNHQGVHPDSVPAGYHEGAFTGYGVLIWHIDTTATDYSDRSHKLFDLELAHGLWNFDPNTFAPTTPNPRYGKDSLDIYERPGTTIKMGYPSSTPAQSFTCFWNAANNNKINFDGSSNPSSDGYRDSVIDYIRMQDVPTRIGVRNIQSPEPYTTATADLLVNNWYGHIAATTTWGPNKAYAITGDITVDSGYTLTIDSGTTVYLQNSEDNQRAGVDTAKIEIRVAKGGNLLVNGKPNFPVKFLSSRSEAQAGTDDWRGIVVDSGAVFACSNAVIRHAYAGIEDRSKYPHTIQNGRIGRCKMYGIYAFETDSLTIRGCRVDSVNTSPGGYGIKIYSITGKGARLANDTTWGCYNGFYIYGSTTSIDTCLVQGTSGGLIAATGIVSEQQTGSDTLRITATKINGYFAGQHLENAYRGRVVVSACSLLSTTSSRSPYAIRSIALQTYLRMRSSRLTEWGDI